MRVAIFVGLPGAVAAALIAFVIIVAPSGILSIGMWGIVVGFASVMVALMIMSLAAPTRIELNNDSVAVNQGPIHREFLFAELSRVYVFTDGVQRRIALAPKARSFVFLGYALESGDFDVLVAGLRARLAPRRIPFTEGVTFAEMWALESSRSSQKTGRNR